ncbi:MAG: hypothetical protein KatS3mg039_1556 [Candidatus Kapaibacterium sp.]|nr:MAG: hypothetical protein KatS3mg039_1556 [Candidatus Kapabacteria bacterium]
MSMLRILLLLCSVFVVAHAQGGANYTAFGLGQQRTTFGTAYEGLAGAAYAVPSDYVFGIANPALWSLVKSTRIQGGYRFNQQQITQAGTRSWQNNGKLDGAALLFAIDTSLEIAASIGVFPSSAINYTSLRRFQIELPDVGVLDGSTTYRGGGGMVTAYAGGSARLAPGIYAGIAFLYGFGLLSDQTETSIVSDAAQRAVSTQNDVLATVGGRAGVYAELGNGWSAGAAVGLFQPLHVERTLIYQSFAPSATQPSFDTSFTTRLSSPLPMSIGGGITYSVRRWLLMLDGEWSPAVTTQYRFSPLAGAGSSYRLSLATNYRGSRSAGAAFTDRVGVSGGLFIQQWPVVVSGAPLREYGASVGLQIPFGGAAMIDAALTAGIRGSGLAIREEFFRLSVTLSVGEVWFVPFRR